MQKEHKKTFFSTYIFRFSTLIRTFAAMSPMEFIQLRAFARQEGAFVGLIWVASFACFILNFSQPLMGMVAMALAACSVVLVAMRLRGFRDIILDGHISARRAMAFVILVFFYAALLLAVAQWAYFEFIDKGFVAAQYARMMDTPEMAAALKSYGMEQQMRESLALIQQMRPIDFALNVLTMNITLGIVYAVPLGLVMKKS